MTEPIARGTLDDTLETRFVPRIRMQ